MCGRRVVRRLLLHGPVQDQRRSQPKQGDWAGLKIHCKNSEELFALVVTCRHGCMWILRGMFLLWAQWSGDRIPGTKYRRLPCWQLESLNLNPLDSWTPGAVAYILTELAQPFLIPHSTPARPGIAIQVKLDVDVQNFRNGHET